MSTKPLILFDIDKTILNTDALVRSLTTALAQFLHCSEDDVTAVLRTYSASLPNNTAFKPKELLTAFSTHFQTSFEELSDVFYTPSLFQAALYPEVIPVLTTLRNQGYTLGLYSQGEFEWQEYKMLVNNLLEMFDKHHRYIRDNKKDPVLIESLPNPTLIIDDRPDVIEFLQQFPHLIPLHMVRNNPSPAEEEYTLSSLNDLFPILDSLSHA